MIYGICSMYGMYGIFTNLGVHVGKYSIQGAYVYIYIHHMNTHTDIYIYPCSISYLMRSEISQITWNGLL